MVVHLDDAINQVHDAHRDLKLSHRKPIKLPLPHLLNHIFETANCQLSSLLNQGLALGLLVFAKLFAALPFRVSWCSACDITSRQRNACSSRSRFRLRLCQLPPQRFLVLTASTHR